MNLLWPSSLFLLGVLPLILGLYLLIQRRRRKYALRYSSLALVREAISAQSRVRRYLPLALFLLAISSLVLALTRPVTSRSFRARWTGHRRAGDWMFRAACASKISIPAACAPRKMPRLSFIDRKLSTNQIGVVAFAGYAQLVQPPTSDINDLRSAINGLNIGRGTAIGGGILEALDTIAEENSDVAPSSGGADLGNEVPPVTGGPPEYMPDIVVLLTDGVYTTGPPPSKPPSRRLTAACACIPLALAPRKASRTAANLAAGGGTAELTRKPSKKSPP